MFRNILLQLVLSSHLSFHFLFLFVLFMSCLSDSCRLFQFFYTCVWGWGVGWGEGQLNQRWVI